MSCMNGVYGDGNGVMEKIVMAIVPIAVALVITILIKAFVFNYGIPEA